MKNIADHSVNVSAFGPPSSVIKLIKKHAHLVNCYPDYTNDDTLSVLGAFFNISKSNIGLGVGSTQILFNLPKFIDYKRAVIPVPTFWQYVTFNEREKKKIRKIELLSENNFKIDYAYLDDVLQSKDALFLCNVNSPTSTIYDTKKIKQLIRRHRDVTFVIDETYLLFRSDFNQRTLVKYAMKYHNVIVVTSLSKFFSLSGLRIGTIVAHKEIVERYMKYFHIPYSIQREVPVVLDHLINTTSYVNDVRIFYDKERTRIYEVIKKEIGDRLICTKPEGNFLFCKIKNGLKSNQVEKNLIKRGVLIRGGHNLSDVNDEWLRFGILKTDQNNKLIRELKRIL